MSLAVALAALYLVALGTPPGRRADAGLFRRVGDTGIAAVHRVGSHALATIDVGSLLLAGTSFVLVALARGRGDRAAAAVAVLGGAILTTEVLKRALAPLDRRLDPGRGVHWTSSFPSGHSTIAMSLALAAVLAAPRVLRFAAAVGGAVYAAVVGVSLVALGWHYPSDVAGGYLVASAWCALALAVLRRRGERAEGRRALVRQRVGILLGGALAAAFAVLVAATLATHPELTHALRFRRSLLATGAGLAALSGLLVAWLTQLAPEPVQP